MSERWTENVPGSGVYRLSYDYPAFGEVTSLAFRLQSGGWAILSAPPNPASTVTDFFKADGVEALVAPNFAHLSGLADWLQLYPDATFFAADTVLDATQRLAKIKPAPVSALEPAAGVDVREAPGTRCGTVWLKSTAGEAPVVYLDEILITMGERPKGWFARLMFRISGVRPGLGVNRLFLKTLCSDPDAHLSGALKLSDGAAMAYVAHGPAITGADLAESRELLRSALTN